MQKLVESHKDYDEDRGSNVTFLKRFFASSRQRLSKPRSVRHDARCFSKIAEILSSWPADLDSERDERFLTISDDML